MALGTNYARNVSAKQVREFELKWARRCVRTGQSREEYLAQFKPEYQAQMAPVWEQAKAQVAKEDV